MCLVRTASAAVVEYKKNSLFILNKTMEGFGIWRSSDKTTEEEVREGVRVPFLMLPSVATQQYSSELTD